MEADPAFTFKLGCECGLDLAIIMIVNLACRRDKFLEELDLVLSQVSTLVFARPLPAQLGTAWHGTLVG